MSVSPHRRQWLTLAVVALGAFVTALGNSIVNVALPSIQDDLHLGLPGVAWVVNGYILAFAVFLLTAGRLADAFGPTPFQDLRQPTSKPTVRRAPLIPAVSEIG